MQLNTMSVSNSETKEELSWSMHITLHSLQRECEQWQCFAIPNADLRSAQSLGHDTDGVVA